MIPVPLLLLAGAGIIIAGKKKKKTRPTSTTETDDFEEGEDVTDEEADEGTGIGFDPGPGGNAGPEYGRTVAKGLRKDKRGHHPWRIKYEADGYHATLISNLGPAPLVLGEVGVTATQRAAKELLRDYFNQALLDAHYKESDFRSDPVVTVAASIGIAANGGNSGGDLGGLQG